MVAFGATRLLADQLIEVDTTDPLTYGLVLAGALVVGLLAAWAPARRATRIDPVEALRDG
jgi:ABC-type lipoprotein release transport system permease subunit